MGRINAFLTAPTTGPLSAPVRRVFARSLIAQAIVAAFNPATQFAAGQQGAWYDPSDYTTLFQDSAGTTPVTAVAQPDGLMLDKRLGLVRGPELIGNGTFATDLSGWVNNINAAWSAGAVLLSATSASAELSRSFTTEIGKSYELFFDFTGNLPNSNIRIGNAAGSSSFENAVVYMTTGTGNRRQFTATATTTYINLYLAYPGVSITAQWDNISVKSVAGNHLSQATASARPLTSARVNLLTKTENFSDPAWVVFGSAIGTPNFGIDPDGATTACRVQLPGVASQFYQIVNVLAGLSYANEWYVKSNTGTNQSFRLKNNAPDAYSADLIATNVWQRFTHNAVTATAGGGSQAIGGNSAGTSADVLVWHPSFANAPTRYQRVNTATDYDTVGFPKYLTFDGIDDGLITGPMTFTADMDCFIAVRRNSTVASVLVFSGTTGGNQFFAVPQVGNAGAADSGSGTPTYAANGVSLNGGLTGTTRDQLHLALPVGSWVVLEVKNLNLTVAAWTSLTLGNYGGFLLNGDIGGIILCPAGDATARQKNRQYLGNKVGLTLP